MKNICITLVCICFSMTLSAQRNPLSGGMGYASIGNAWINNNRINEQLTGNGFAAFSPASMMVGGGGFGIIRNFMIGGEGAVITPNQINATGFKAALTSGYGMFQFGILPQRSRSPFMIYPVWGLGYGGTRYRHEIDGISSEVPYVAVSDQWFMKAELNIATFPLTHTKRGQYAGFCGIFTAGFLMNPSSQSWIESTPNPLGIEPAQAYTSGWYVKFSIGGGGIGPHRKTEKE
jgi:hypothetical protein